MVITAQKKFQWRYRDILHPFKLLEAYRWHAFGLSIRADIERRMESQGFMRRVMARTEADMSEFAPRIKIKERYEMNLVEFIALVKPSIVDLEGRLERLSNRHEKVAEELISRGAEGNEVVEFVKEIDTTISTWLREVLAENPTINWINVSSLGYGGTFEFNAFGHKVMCKVKPKSE